MPRPDTEETPVADGCLLCPSARAEAGAAVIGIVQQDGKVGILGTPLPVDTDSLASMNEGRSPEKRFRFAAPCVMSDCRQWAVDRCGVIDKVMGSIQREENNARPSLHACGIRAGCRWFTQAGANACAVCPLVVTDTLV